MLGCIPVGIHACVVLSACSGSGRASALSGCICVCIHICIPVCISVCIPGCVPESGASVLLANHHRCDKVGSAWPAGCSPAVACARCSHFLLEAPSMP